MVFFGEPLYDFESNGGDVQVLAIACLALMLFSYFFKVYDVMLNKRECKKSLKQGEAPGEPEQKSDKSFSLYGRVVNKLVEAGYIELYPILVLNMAVAFNLTGYKDLPFLWGKWILAIIFIVRFTRMVRWTYLIKRNKELPVFLQNINGDFLLAGTALVFLFPLLLFVYKTNASLMLINTLLVCMLMIIFVSHRVVMVLYAKTNANRILVRIISLVCILICIVPFVIMQLPSLFFDNLMDKSSTVGISYLLIVGAAAFIYVLRYFKNIEDYSKSLVGSRSFMLWTPLSFVAVISLTVFTVNVNAQKFDDIFDEQARYMVTDKAPKNVPESLNAFPLLEFFHDQNPLKKESFGDADGLLNDIFTLDEDLVEKIDDFVDENKIVLDIILEVSNKKLFYTDEFPTVDMDIFELASISIAPFTFLNDSYDALTVKTLYHLNRNEIDKAKDTFNAGRRLINLMADARPNEIFSVLLVRVMVDTEISLRKHLLERTDIPLSFFDNTVQVKYDSINRSFVDGILNQNLMAIRTLQLGSEFCLSEERLAALGMQIDIVKRLLMCPILSVSKSVSDRGSISSYLSGRYNALTILKKESLKKNPQAHEYVKGKFLYIARESESARKDINSFIFNVTSARLGYDNLIRSFSYYTSKQNVLAKLQLIRASEAVIKYRKKYKKNPESISELENLMSVSLYDPFLNMSRPLKMVKKKDTIVLYSVGPDGIDDNGTEIKNRQNNWDYDGTKEDAGDIVFEMAI